MAKQDNYLTIERDDPTYRPVESRIKDFDPVKGMLSPSDIARQALRCMDCGVPFCHMYGCPLGNRVPDYTEAVAQGQWREALDILHSTNNFPEITGRICPALCEASCTLAVNFEASSCQHIELQIAEMGWEKGWIVPEPAPIKSGKRVAVIGSGPTGLAAAQQLARKGHEVVVFEKSDRVGGMLMYGIPNFKLEKEILSRRIDQMQQEGVFFETQVEIGTDLSARYILSKFDAVVIASGTPLARDLDIPGRDLEGIHFAMEYLHQQTRLVLGDDISSDQLIEPKGKHVVVIGGGDTGADCVGSVIRRGCASVTQIELLPKPPEERTAQNPWPQWPMILRTSSSHLEGVERRWSLLSKRFEGTDGRVTALHCVELAWEGRKFTEKGGSETVFDADLVLLSMGFVPYRESPLATDFSLELDRLGNIVVDSTYRTSVEKIFAAGDAVTGASLVVRAINHGRECARSVDSFLSESQATGRHD
ncbi:MAG: glutamate synthase subunit beta [Sphaerochaeta sp.]|jgi:NAD(P)H-dependent glutamate synthase small subunit|nr:glutamate synthase subunit beta [Sphaerochaeta sp.]PKL29396.1 MAG: glutamate synthase [Spirochaetae bacterium HGW-Spirochaetae-2]